MADELRSDVPHPTGSQRQLAVDPELLAADDSRLRDFLRHAFRALAPNGTLLVPTRSESERSRVERLGALEGFLLRQVSADGVSLTLRKEGDSNAAALPLVSIVIPSYKPRYFTDALRSAADQTYPNIEIIVSDNCPTDAIEQIVDNFAGAHPVSYFRNARLRYWNVQKCLELSRGKYVKFLLDDDLLAPTCVHAMVRWFEAYSGAVSLVTSRRKRIDEWGNPLPDAGYNWMPDIRDQPWSGRAAGRELLVRGVNFIGELTTMMFPRTLVADNAPFFWSLSGRDYPGLADLAISLVLLARGDLVYLSEVLSCFRIHGEQHLKSAPQSINLDHWLDWFHLVNDGRSLGFLDDDAYANALFKVRKRFLRRKKAFDSAGQQTLAAHVKLIEDEIRGLPGSSRRRLLVEQLRARLRFGR